MCAVLCVVVVGLIAPGCTTHTDGIGIGFILINAQRTRRICVQHRSPTRALIQPTDLLSTLGTQVSGAGLNVYLSVRFYDRNDDVQGTGLGGGGVGGGGMRTRSASNHVDFVYYTYACMCVCARMLGPRTYRA